MLREKLDNGDLALVDVLEDPIFCTEFLRSTRDGSVNRSLWPSKPFEYRHYQRALISDKSEKIVLLGGRSIGKCQPTSANVYTTKGYQKIVELRKKPVFEVYCLDDDGNLVTRRAVLQKDKWTKTYRVVTESGYEVHGTGNHPLLTNNGYREIEELQHGDMVAVATVLPWNSQNRLWRWHELRLFGYVFLKRTWRLGTEIVPRWKPIANELEHIAKLSDMLFTTNGTAVFLHRKQYKNRNIINQMGWELGFFPQIGVVGYNEEMRYIPPTLKAECLDNLKVFLEAVFAQYGNLKQKSISIDCLDRRGVYDFRELLLRFGIETLVEDTVLHLRDERAVYRFYSTFSIPGVNVDKLDSPPESNDFSSNLRFEPIKIISKLDDFELTYSLYVYDYHNYITGGVFSHNSLVLEDKFVYDVLNQDIEYPETKETLLATANQAQLEPILGRLVTRFTSSLLLKEFLQNRINRSLGILDFRFKDVQFLIRARIAGQTGSQNMVGLHLPKISVDEAQLFNIGAWNQLNPSWNSWERKKQIFVCGVSNGLRTSLLYYADKKLSGWKRYHIPSHNNPYYDRQTDLDNIKKYGGEESDDYQQLVIGKHGAASFTVITRDQIKQDTYPFYNYRFGATEISRGVSFELHLERPELKDYVSICAGIDCGYVDPTIINVIGLNKSGIWRCLLRYKIQRVDFTVQERIIDWLDSFYKFDKIGIDAGSGGGGVQMLHSFLYRDQYKRKGYEGRIVPVQFGERIAVGFDSNGKELMQTTKTLGATLLIQRLQQRELMLSEIDHEAVSELERMTKLRGINGDDRYFILSEKGNGASENDHIFASFICWAIATRDLSFQKKRRKKLGRSGGAF